MFAFRAMTTDVRVTSESGDEEKIAGDVAALFYRAERRFSRFREDSELSRLNRSRGPMVVSAELFAVLSRAQAYTEMTQGIFDAGAGAALIGAGYDRSFAPDALDRDERQRLPATQGRFRDVRLDPRTRTVERPAHIHLDLGGMIKGATVDAAAAMLPGAGAIDAGGDAALVGNRPGAAPWVVEVEHPFDARRIIATLELSDRAVATSAANRRRWRRGAAIAHHLIDPRTQASALSDVVQATVVARRAELADVLAKVAFVLGADEARTFLERQPDVGALLVRGTDGALEVLSVGDIAALQVARA